jgi:hypothetical protein
MSNHLDDIAKRESRNSRALTIGGIVAVIIALLFYVMFIR